MTLPAAQREQLVKAALAEQEDRVLHFQRRAAELGVSSEDAVVVLLHVDCPVAGPLAQALMPDNEAGWQAHRATGARPYARGLAGRPFVQGYLDSLGGSGAAEVLRGLHGPLAVVVMDYEMALVAQVEAEHEVVA